MKKLVLSLTAICAAVSLNAQQNLVNGNFEATMTAAAGYAYTYQTTGWGFLINAGPEAVASEGAQAVKLVTTSDAVLQTALSGANPEIAGQIAQAYEGPFTDVANMTVSFMYKTENMGTGSDVAFIQVAVYDTLAAGATDDVALYFDNMEFPTDVATWTSVTFTMNATAGTGTANLMEFSAVSSQLGTYEAGVPSVGGTLWLDDIKIGPSTSGIEEVVGLTSNVYPNPATDVLNINTNTEAISVSVISMDGKVVASQDMNGTSTAVNVAGLKTGAYFYEVKAADGSVVRNTFMKK